MDKLNQVAIKNNKLEKYYSLKGNFWSERDHDRNIFDSLKSKFSNEYILLQLLVSRNISTKKIEDFINPKLKNLLPDPYTIDDMIQVNLTEYTDQIDELRIELDSAPNFDANTIENIFRDFNKLKNLKVLKIDMENVEMKDSYITFG